MQAATVPAFIRVMALCMSAHREIRKYANRRLYDLAASRYINRDGLRELIAQGENVRVIDDVSGEDITRALLLQLLSEQELGGRPVLSDTILMELIRLCEHPMQAALGSYLQQSIEAFIQQRQSMQEPFRGMSEGFPGSDFSDLVRANLESWMALSQSMFKPDKPKSRR